MEHHRRPATRPFNRIAQSPPALAALAAAFALSGCDTTLTGAGGTGGSTTMRRGIETMPQQPQAPGHFPWENQPLRRSGESNEPSPGSPTSDLVARAEARRSALRALEAALRELPVNDSATVGQAMDRSVSLSLALTRLLQKATLVEGSVVRQADGRMALTLELPTAEIAAALRAHKVTPEKGLPSQPYLPDAAVPGAPIV